MDRAKWQAQMVAAEGDRRDVYDDATSSTIRPGTLVKGNPTTLVGCNLNAYRFSDAVRDLVFEEQTLEASADLTTHFSWWLTLDDVRQRAVLEMRFNLGGPTFREFAGPHGTLEACAAREWDTAADRLAASAVSQELPSRYARICAWLRTGQDS